VIPGGSPGPKGVVPRVPAALVAAVITMASGVAGIGFLLVPTRPGIESPGVSPAAVLKAIYVLVAPALGALLAARRPDRIGWLLIASTFFFVLSFLGDGLARHLDPVPVVVWFDVIANALGYFAFVILFAIFRRLNTDFVTMSERIRERMAP
jgi:hypothetical protein